MWWGWGLWPEHPDFDGDAAGHRELRGEPVMGDDRAEFYAVVVGQWRHEPERGQPRIGHRLER
jgi:hypothetical protein